VAVGMPADLLRRRPDVRREERLAAARSAEIGIADADFYPAISILGTIGYSAQNFGDLFNTQAFRGTIGPSFQWNILNYGRILSHVRLQDAKFQEQIAKYQNTALKANEEVENGLVTFLRAHQRTRFAAESVKAAEKAVKVAMTQYRAGTIDFNRVALLEQNLVSQQNLLAEARGEIAQGLILVYKALGGGWQIRETGCEEGLSSNCNPVQVPVKVKVQCSPDDSVVPPQVMPPAAPAHRLLPPVQTLQGVGDWR